MRPWKLLKMSALVFLVPCFIALCHAEVLLVPSHVVQDFLKSYSPEELKKIEKDHVIIKELCFGETLAPKKHYVATAGGPGASKTTVLETYLHAHPGFVYTDPDQRALKFMVHTYIVSNNNYAISQSASFQDLLKKSYKKWRGASNYIANSILNDAFAKGMPIAHGTTSTAKTMGSFYETLKQQGYHITLLLCVSREDNRLAAVKHRAQHQAFVQSTSEDVIQKGKLFFENFPLYFKWADDMELYLVEDFSKNALLVGTWTKEKGLKILHKDFQKLKNLYEDFRRKNNPSLHGFDALLDSDRWHKAHTS